MRIENKKCVWEAEEIQWLISNYSYMTNDELARHLGCSSPTVRLKGKELGLIKKHSLKVHRRKFSDEEIQYIRDHYPTDAQCDVAEHLHVSPPTIYRIVKELGLKKSSEYDRKRFRNHIVKNYKHERYSNFVR